MVLQLLVSQVDHLLHTQAQALHTIGTPYHQHELGCKQCCRLQVSTLMPGMGNPPAYLTFFV